MKRVIDMIFSIIVIVFCGYIQYKTSYNLALVYVYCFYNIIKEIDKIIKKQNK